MATNLYGQASIPVLNGDFEVSSALPPVNWTNGFAVGTPSSIILPGTLSYDTSTPYQGTRSLVVTADGAGFEGAATIAPFPVKAGEAYTVSAAVRVVSGAITASIQLSFLDVNGNYLPNVYTAKGSALTSWALLSARIIVPPGAATAVIFAYVSTAAAGVAEFDAVTLTRAVANSYYLGLLTSQYQNSPNLKTLLSNLAQPFIDTAACANSLAAAFALATAVGSQLDALGQILGVGRTLPFNPVGASLATTAAIVATGVQSVAVNNTTYLVVGQSYTITGADAHTESVVLLSVVPGVSINANFTQTHVIASTVIGAAPSAKLGDDDYRILLQARVIQNQFNGHYDGAFSVLWQAWQTLFPSGQLFITDNQNMSATIFLLGAFSPVQQQMITNGLIVPRAEGVQFTYTFPVLPLFGFDNLNPSFVRGFDTGRWD